MQEKEKGHCKHGEFDLMAGCSQCIEERRAASITPAQDEMEEGLNAEGLTLAGAEPFIVKVQYSEGSKGYTYYSVDRLNVGDIVWVPIRETTAKGTVIEIDVPASEIAAFKDKVKTIPAGSKIVEPADDNIQGRLVADEKASEEAGTLVADLVMNQKAEPEPAYHCPPDCRFSLDGSPTGGCAVVDKLPLAFEYANDPSLPLCPEYQAPPAAETALATRPGADVEVMSYFTEALKLQQYAEGMVIATVEDTKEATDNLSIISKLKKAMEEKRREYLAPLKAQTEAINETYKALMEPVFAADKTTRAKMGAFDAEQRRIRAEMEEVNRLRMEAARKEAALNGTGEIQEPVNLIEVAPEVRGVSTNLGSSGMTDHWKYEVVDFALLPDAYKMVDNAQLTAIARRHHDQKQVPGVRFYNEPFVAVRAR